MYQLIRSVVEDNNRPRSKRIEILGILWNRANAERKDLIDPRFIATIAHRIARLQQGNRSHRQEVNLDSLLEDIATAAKSKLPEFNPQDIANTAWAFAKLGVRNDALFEKIASTAQIKLPEFDSQGIANTAWAFAKLGIRNDALFDKIAKAALTKLSEFKPQAIANTAWAFATLGIQNDAIFEEMADAAQRKLWEFNPQDIANTAWAFATLGIRNDAIFEKMADAAQRKLREFNPQDIANTAWALAIHSPRLVSKLIDLTLLEDTQLAEFEWLQVYQALLIAQLVSPKEQFARYKKILQNYTPENKNPFEISVEKAISQAFGGGRSLSHGNVIAGIATDFIFEFNGRQIVIECDGDRFHRSIGPNGGQPFGRDCLQDSLFRLFGYEVVHM